MNKPFLGVSLMPEDNFLIAALPLFQTEKIEVVEWSFDTISNPKNRPEWLQQTIAEYGENNKLIGHGVYYSLFDARWNTRQEQWLKNLKNEVSTYNYSHITEHFGYMSNSNAHKGCPLPITLNTRTLAIGIDRISRIQDTAQLPVGVENLALAFSKTDVLQQADFLQQLIAPINGFLILDLHNLYCQAHNFNIDIIDLINCYPLQSVKEIHLSGGSWQQSIYATSLDNVRRDTHDDTIPIEVFDVLPYVLQKCTNVEYVIIERLGNTFTCAADYTNYSTDYEKAKTIINHTHFTKEIKKWGNKLIPPAIALNDIELYNEQQNISTALYNATNPEELIRELHLNNWDTTTWNPEMIHTAMLLVKKWN
jgi:uncharacterized protein (UPF0276 family)